MIADGPRAPCFQCSTVFEFAGGVVVDARWSESPCLGCERWFAILAEVARRTAAEKPSEQEAEPVELTPAAILARLLENRRRASTPEPFDARMAAAEGRE